jgi:hypothetical protein
MDEAPEVEEEAEDEGTVEEVQEHGREQEGDRGEVSEVEENEAEGEEEDEYFE